MSAKNCFWCEEPNVALIECDQCHLVQSCPEHLDLHQGRGRCHLFKVKSDPDVGRFLVAVRPIRPLEVIMTDWPLVVGPSRQLVRKTNRNIFSTVFVSYFRVVKLEKKVIVKFHCFRFEVKNETSFANWISIPNS